MAFGNTVKPWIDSFNPPIPSEYSDAMSYEEELRACHRKLVDGIRALDNAQQNLKAYLDGQITAINADLKNQIAQAKADMMEALEQESQILQNAIQQSYDKSQTLIMYVNRDLQNTKDALNARLDAMEQSNSNRYDQFVSDLAQVSGSISRLTSQVAVLESDQLEFKQDVLTIFDNLQSELTGIIMDQISKANSDNLLVTDPKTGQIVPLRSALQSILDIKTPYPVTADQFNSMEITADEFNAMCITADQLDDWGGMVFFERLHLTGLTQRVADLEQEVSELKNAKVGSQISGDLLSQYEYSNEIVQYMLSTKFKPITADDFNAADITAEDFNSKSLTSTQFNLYGLGD